MGVYKGDTQRWEILVGSDMDLYTVPALKEEIMSSIAETKADIYLDATNMGYIDSTGLGVLVSALNRVKEYGGKITIKGLKPHIRRIFHLTGLDGAFEMEN